MSWKSILPLAGLALLLAAAGCGPEAETGAVFSKYSAQACAAPSPADTIDPDLDDVNRIPELEESRVSASPAAPAGQTEMDELMGKFEPAKHPDFVTVGRPYTDKSDMLLRREAYTAFRKMWSAARSQGVVLRIISSTRNFDYQKGIWERKWSRLAMELPDPEARARKILEYSAMPGASRHHWGTDIDLNDLNNGSFEAGGSYEKVYQWLQNNAHAYGFYQPYTRKDDNRPNGYNEEKWHWSYRPLAAPMLQQYESAINDQMLKGFSGAETAPAIGIVKNYVSGVDAACR